jgi:hypothetical protein
MINPTEHNSKAVLFLICIFISYQQASGQGNINDEQMKVQGVVRDLFEAFSENSLQKMKPCLTDDILILEHDVVWNMDTLVAYIQKPRQPDFKRINTLIFFQTEIGKDMAFVSYYNEADVTSGNAKWHLKWLESAVLVKANKRWKIKMLHSTRLAREKVALTH